MKMRNVPNNDAPQSEAKRRASEPPAELRDLIPSLDDRILMLRTVNAAAGAVLSSSRGASVESTAPPTDRPKRGAAVASSPDGAENSPEAPPAVRASASGDVGDRPRAAAEDGRGSRSGGILRGGLPKLASAYLLLDPDPGVFAEGADSDTDADATWPPDRYPSDAFGCVVLILAHHVLVSGKMGYDARVRNVIKLASILALYEPTKPCKTKAEACLQMEVGDVGRTCDGEETATDNGEGESDASSSHIVEFSQSASTLSDFLDESYDKVNVGGGDRDQPVAASDDGAKDPTKTEPHYRKAVMQFHAIERAIAAELYRALMSTARDEGGRKGGGPAGSAGAGGADGDGDGDGGGKRAVRKSSSFSREGIIRGVKIGSAGIVAGALFAVTGGMAAPGIAAGIAALGIGTAVAAVTSTAAVAAMFGVGGGGLAAYKMKTRTGGLAEFRVRKEDRPCDRGRDGGGGERHAGASAEVRATVCVSGWLDDAHDFQRPWGVALTDPPLTDKLELLRRFYAVHNPKNVALAEAILSEWRGREAQLWRELEKKYGRDPDHLFPLHRGDCYSLTQEEERRLSDLLGALFASAGQKGAGGPKPTAVGTSTSTKKAVTSSAKNKSPDDQVTTSTCATSTEMNPSVSKELVVWDYHTSYGGDVFTITWESDRLLKLCDYISALAMKLAKDASKEVLKQTALATIMSAVAWPSALKKVADLIDGPWTIITLRSDEAGAELANCLLQSEDHRPVTLVGFSFGARVVFSCLKELARHQVLWQNRQNRIEEEEGEKFVAKDAGSAVQYSREPASIVEGAIMMGMPAFIDQCSWLACRHVVAGRLINCHSSKDWILKLMFQYQTMTGVFRATCGTSPVTGVRGVENYDVSELVTTQSSYCAAVQDILQLVRHDEPRVMLD